jgi:hypothetical protein
VVRSSSGELRFSTFDARPLQAILRAEDKVAKEVNDHDKPNCQII